MTGWGSPAIPEVSSDSAFPTHQAPASDDNPVVEEPVPLQPQTTGGLWSNWWTSSGGEKSTPTKKKEVDNSAKSYISAIQSCKTPDMKLVKHLISLRVHLSTAKLAFIQDFVIAEQGLQVLGSLLATMVGKSGKRKRLSEVETTVLVELIKCFRVLLNTEVQCSCCILLRYH
jgi:hypothetical protein